MSDFNQGKQGQAPEDNLRYNMERWGKPENWENLDSYGYNWGSGNTSASYLRVPGIVRRTLLPHIDINKGLHVLEIAPGAGRCTTELLRFSASLTLVDLNKACIDLCKERFRYYDCIKYFVNDGVSLDMIEAESMDLVASFDAFVHIGPEIIANYLKQIHEKLKPGGIAWIHHPGSGPRIHGRRTDMDFLKFKSLSEQLGFEVLAIYFTDGGLDCISLLHKPSN